MATLKRIVCCLFGHIPGRSYKIWVPLKKQVLFAVGIPVYEKEITHCLRCEKKLTEVSKLVFPSGEKK